MEISGKTLKKKQWKKRKTKKNICVYFCVFFPSPTSPLSSTSFFSLSSFPSFFHCLFFLFSSFFIFIFPLLLFYSFVSIILLIFVFRFLWCILIQSDVQGKYLRNPKVQHHRNRTSPPCLLNKLSLKTCNFVSAPRSKENTFEDPQNLKETIQKRDKNF